MEYVLTEKQAKDIQDDFEIDNGPYGNFTLWQPLAINEKQGITVIRYAMNDTVYVCENNDFSKCIATGNLEWWESVKSEYFMKGFTEDLSNSDDEK